jgi:trans-aconitate 2-methyltransferase
MDNNTIVSFYDKFVPLQQKSGLNERIYSLYKRLIKLGLNSNSSVLELGCGIGLLSNLLAKKTKNGLVESVDISPESIQIARQRANAKNLVFHVHDIVSFHPTIKNIDFITLFDVLEHIPIQKHHELFQNLSKYCGDNTRILINIPNPEYIKFDMQYNPHVLQIIDQPLHLNHLVDVFESNGFWLQCFENYSIWVENDYQFFVLTKNKKYENIDINANRSILQKFFHRLKCVFIFLRYG